LFPQCKILFEFKPEHNNTKTSVATTQQNLTQQTPNKLDPTNLTQQTPSTIHQQIHQQIHQLLTIWSDQCNSNRCSFPN
jgi:hypothetical protein